MANDWMQDLYSYYRPQTNVTQTGQWVSDNGLSGMEYIRQQEEQQRQWRESLRVSYEDYQKIFEQYTRQQETEKSLSDQEQKELTESMELLKKELELTTSIDLDISESGQESGTTLKKVKAKRKSKRRTTSKASHAE